jgi:hypothetical protein
MRQQKVDHVAVGPVFLIHDPQKRRSPTVRHVTAVIPGAVQQITRSRFPT